MKKYLNWKEKKEKYWLTAYSAFQALFLALLRKYCLLTTYQTVAAYLAVCAAGWLVLFFLNGQRFSSCKHTYLLAWSAFHGTIVMGLLTRGTFQLTLTQVTIVQMINLFLGFAVYWIFYLLTGRCATAVGAGNTLFGILGVLNHYLMRFRGAPFQLSDIKAAATAANVAQNFDYTPDIYLLAGVADLVVWYLLVSRVCRLESGQCCEDDGRSSGQQRRRSGVYSRFGIWNVAVSVLTAAGCLTLVFGPYQDWYSQTGQFSKDCSYLADLLADALNQAESYPEGYSAEYAEAIASEFLQQKESDAEAEEEQSERAETEDAQQPNIVVIMNEAFSDLRVLGDFSTDLPVLSYWDSLGENCIRGWADVSVYGGTTANSEYEFLSSDATALYSGGAIPYTGYFEYNDSYPGLVSVLKQQGYETTAFHPYLSGGWSRTEVYQSMQFDRTIFSDDLEEELDMLRLYVSDKGDYAFIRQLFEEKEEGVPQFLFNVTMQNHSGYTYDGDNFETTVHLTGDAAGRFEQTEQYLSLIKASDEALEELLTYFESYEEPVIVVVFGDHQPRLESDFYTYVTGTPMEEWDAEQQANLYRVPFLIWHNYDTEEAEIGDISLNYLAPLLLRDAGLSMSSYQEYLLERYLQFPVVNIVGIRDAEGTLYPWGSEEIQEVTEELQTLVYNHTVDKDGRLREFYE